MRNRPFLRRTPSCLDTEHRYRFDADSLLDSNDGASLRIVFEMPTVTIETHGCKLNTADSIAMADDFMASGFDVRKELDASADVFVLNSCTVTHVADKKARQRVGSSASVEPRHHDRDGGMLPDTRRWSGGRPRSS